LPILLLVLAALLAFANGSNDNGKGVATLVGYGAATPGRALAYATGTTLLGAAASFWFSAGLLESFSTGVFAAGTPLGQAFFVAVLIGAFGWVIVATFTGLPVSTTHAIAGSLIGAGLVAFGRSAVQWQALGTAVVVPLALSPVLSLALVYGLAWPAVWAIRRYGERCVCVVEEEPALAACGAAGAVASMARAAGPSQAAVVVGTEAECATRSPAVAVSTSSAANAVHWFGGGMIGFARGWNDAPKIAALCLVALPNRMGLAFGIVAVAMAVGGLTAGRRVLETLAKKLTPLPLAESLAASLTTAGLVCLASWNGLPVSTTQVSTGAIVGAGLKHDPREVKWKKIGEIAASWLVTLPAAAAIAAGAAWVLG
jgi:PiT family inorganic phosphate transporter